MVTTTVINVNNLHTTVADQAQGTDFFYPSSAGSAVSSTAQSWKLSVDKTGLSAGVKYLTIAVEYQYSTGWQQDVSNAPDGWVGGINTVDGVTTTIDFLSSSVGSHDANGNLIGERPSHIRLHVLFSNGSTLRNVTFQTATDLSLV